MPTYVQECPQLFVLATNHDDTVTTNIARHEVADFRNLTHVANKLPPPQEESVILELE